MFQIRMKNNVHKKTFRAKQLYELVGILSPLKL